MRTPSPLRARAHIVEFSGKYGGTGVGGRRVRLRDWNAPRRINGGPRRRTIARTITYAENVRIKGTAEDYPGRTAALQTRERRGRLRATGRGTAYVYNGRRPPRLILSPDGAVQT